MLKFLTRMLDTFKARLKAKAKAAGANLSQKRIDALADRLNKKNPDLNGDDAEHDAKIDDLYDEQDYKDFASVDDHQRAKEAKEKKDKEAAKAKSGSEPDTDKGNEGDEMPSWAKALLTEVQTLKKEKAQSTIAEKLKGNDKLRDIPASFYKGRPLPENDEGIEAFVTDVVTDHTAFLQEMGYSQVTPHTPVKGVTGKPGEKAKIDPDLVAFAKKQNEKAVKK